MLDIETRPGWGLTLGKVAICLNIDIRMNINGNRRLYPVPTSPGVYYPVFSLILRPFSPKYGP